jgi:hypothetical protein
MATDRKLAALARGFAESVQEILNTTICSNVRIGTFTSADASVVSIGYGVGRSSFETTRFPVGTKSSKPRCWLKVGYVLALDSSGDHLTVEKSLVSVYAADDDTSFLCRLDYERDKQGYPEAHLQIKGESAALAAWPGKPRRELERLHFPMGGRRYRPTLEDFIEFLVLEGLAEARSGWRDVLDAGRDAYRRIQLRAAIRRDPLTALDTIGDPLFA